MSDPLVCRLEQVTDYADWAGPADLRHLADDVVPALVQAITSAHALAVMWRAQADDNDREATKPGHAAPTRDMLQAAAYELRTRADALDRSLTGPLNGSRFVRAIGDQP